MANVADMFKSVVDRRVIKMSVEGKELIIKEPCAAIARKVFQAEAERTQKMSSSHKKVLDYQARLQNLSEDDPEYAEKANSIQSGMVPFLQEIVVATVIADIKPLLLVLGDQVTEEWLEHNIGISQLEAIARAVATVCDPKNLAGVGATPAETPTPATTPLQ